MGEASCKDIYDSKRKKKTNEVSQLGDKRGDHALSASEELSA